MNFVESFIHMFHWSHNCFQSSGNCKKCLFHFMRYNPLLSAKIVKNVSTKEPDGER